MDSITRDLKLDNPKDVEKLYQQLKSSQIEFESIVGRQFDDNIYELHRRFQEEQIQKQEEIRRKKEERKQKRENAKKKLTPKEKRKNKDRRSFTGNEEGDFAGDSEKKRKGESF